MNLIIVYSCHHQNTARLAAAIGAVIDARIAAPEKISPQEITQYDLVGFGSGIYSEQHHESIIELAKKLPPVRDKRAFIFSTSSGVGPAAKNHILLKDMLESKGYRIIGEFACPGYNTNSFLKLFGGINKGRPNSKDLSDAKLFALELLK